MRKYLAMMLALALTVSLCACSGLTQSGNGTSIPESNTTNASETASTDTITPQAESDDLIITSPTDSSATEISASGTSATISGTGAAVSGSTVTINKAGKYIIDGTLSDGQIIVNTQDKETVFIVFNNFSAACSSSAPIYVVDAKKVVLTLYGDNSLTDTSNYVFASAAESEPDAALFCKSDLTVNGTGTLTVTANYADGIKCKDVLKLLGGTLTVSSVDDGIIGRDAIVSSENTALKIKSGGDGLKTTNDEDTSLGSITINSGTYDITSESDGIQAITELHITGGDFNIVTGGGSGNAAKVTAAPGFGGFSSSYTDTETSCKALKAGSLAEIKDGNFKIDSCDDSLHSNNAVKISGGTFSISSGDDAIHADTSIEINNGTIDVLKAYEGIESTTITINNGEIHLKTSDDGINVYGGNDASALGGRPGQNTFNDAADETERVFTMNNGYLYVNSDGDGLDSNGAILITGGTIITDGPTNSGNGALDYTTGCTISGGTLIAAGSIGMAQSPGSTSSVCSIVVSLPSQQEAQTPVSIVDSNGNEVLTYKPSKVFQSVIIASPLLKSGEKYTVYYAGSHSGISKDGLMSSGSYTPGTELETVTLTSVITAAGSSSYSDFGGMGAPGGITPPQGGKFR
ncbi:MAG: carbohydrate-binding domain-containing protein [Clostridiales bacterium]|nr:carbohydrate-binding domain-containing protein [Clostridiales bacterium]